MNVEEKPGEKEKRRRGLFRIKRRNAARARTRKQRIPTASWPVRRMIDAGRSG